MRQTSLLLGFILSLFTATVMAHGEGHSNTPVNQATAKSKATQIVAALVSRDKLDKSWGSITASTVEKKEFKGNPEWEVIFINAKITDTKKQTLYVYLTLSGNYIAMNHTGQ